MVMIRGIESVLLFSEDAKNLAEFYRDKVGLKLTSEAEVGEEGEENFYSFEFGEDEQVRAFGTKTCLYIMDHSEVEGKQKEPERIVFNLEVSDIQQDAKKLIDAGIKQIAEIYHMEGYGWIATFEDIDGNYFQLVQIRPSEAE